MTQGQTMYDSKRKDLELGNLLRLREKILQGDTPPPQPSHDTDRAAVTSEKQTSRSRP